MRYKVLGLGLTQNDLEDHYKEHKSIAAEVFRNDTDRSNQSEMDEKLGILNTLLDQVLINAYSIALRFKPI